MSQTLQASGKIPVFARSDNPVNFVSATDVAALTALAITEPGLRGQVLELGGPDNLTFNRLAAIVQEPRGAGHRPAHSAPGSAGDRMDGRRHQTRAGPPGPRRAGILLGITPLRLLRRSGLCQGKWSRPPGASGLRIKPSDPRTASKTLSSASSRMIWACAIFGPHASATAAMAVSGQPTHRGPPSSRSVTGGQGPAGCPGRAQPPPLCAHTRRAGRERSRGHALLVPPSTAATQGGKRLAR
jgi:hypothetical protein